MRHAFETDIDVRVITSLFSGGAERTADSLRGPSLKGQILCWYRALLGAFVDEPAKARQISAECFGEQSVTSRLQLVVSAEDPGGTVPLASQGIRYLAFGLDARSSYDPAQRPNIRIRLVAEDEATWKAATASPWLLSRLGGIGGRSRRGMGGVELEPVAPRNAIPPGTPAFGPLPNANCAADVADFLNDGLTALLKRFGWEAAGSRTVSARMPDWSCFAPGFRCGVVADASFPDWESALDKLSEHYAAFRKPGPRVRRIVGGKPRSYWLSMDYDAANTHETHGVAAPVQSKLAVFGLPLAFHFTSGTHQGSVVGVRENGIASDLLDPVEDAAKDSRRASPLFLRVVRTADGKFWPLAHVFKSRLLKKRGDMEFIRRA